MPEHKFAKGDTIVSTLGYLLLHDRRKANDRAIVTVGKILSTKGSAGYRVAWKKANSSNYHYTSSESDTTLKNYKKVTIYRNLTR